jgi:competence protein ComEA
MIARIALAAGVALVIAALALRHPAPQGTIQSLSVATANAGVGVSHAAEARHRLHRTAPPDELVVYVAGAVKRPGLYLLKYGDRYERAVALAGGFAPSADAAGVNLAERVADGEEIYVPLAGETPRTRVHGARPRRRTPSPPPDGSVDVNAAGAAELAAVPGIGRAVAARIVEVRERDGSFASLDELLDVAGMTQSRLERARPYLRNP